MTMFREFLLVWVLLCLMNTLQAGIDQEYGEKPSWWASYYNEFLSRFGIEKNYALVIGVGEYSDNSFQKLPSEKDAVRIKDYLINEAGFDYVRLITGEQVTVEKIRRLMYDYYPKLLTKQDRFLFYWSGHGVTTGNSRKQGFLAVQSSQERFVSTMINMNDLTHWDRRFKAKQTLYLLDACFSGIAASTAMSAKRDQTIERVSRPSSQVMVAGLPDEQTIALEDINGGVFTRAVLDGLRGHADTDKGVFKKDGVVTSHELVEYVRERVDHERRRVGWSKPITPRLAHLSRHEGDFFFVADKRVLKQPKALMKERGQTKVVATGVRIQLQNQEQVLLRKSKDIRYRDNGDGTVTDNQHGLMWKRCLEGLSGHKCNIGELEEHDWPDTISKFEKTSFASYDDWRVPTISELSTLVDCGNNIPTKEALQYSCRGKNSRVKKYQDPTNNQKFFPNTTPADYKTWSAWSSTEKLNGHNQAWGVSFHNGMKYDTSKNYKDSVRLVRSR